MSAKVDFEGCGVKSASYFMRQFKARTGMTMLQCRRRKSIKTFMSKKTIT